MSLLIFLVGSVCSFTGRPDWAEYAQRGEPKRKGRIAYVPDINSIDNTTMRVDMDSNLFMVDEDGNKDTNELQEAGDALW